MLIKIIYSGQKSDDWIASTNKHHRLFIAEKPDEVLAHIKDLYPDSPEVGTVIRMNFECFW